MFNINHAFDHFLLSFILKSFAFMKQSNHHFHDICKDLIVLDSYITILNYLYLVFYYL
uniref:Uncharacterized protein n=1 Tax=Arundo donax TaxID=35708 RepID=A0A0A9AN32_ARUDO